jgi:hypothetical protein
VRLTALALLGTPRSPGAESAPTPGWAFWAPLLALVAGCVVVAAAPARVGAALQLAVATVATEADPGAAGRALAPLAILLPMLTGATALVTLLRAALGRRPQPARSATWGCGYPSATPTMQYTSTSFGEPLTRVFQPVLRSEARVEVDGDSRSLWPLGVRWTSSTLDRALVAVYLPLFAAVGRAGARLRDRYRPRVTTSLLYIVVTVLVLLALLFLPEAQR